LQPLKVEILCKISVTKACNHYCVVIVMKKYTLKWKATRRFLGVIMEVSFRNLQTFRVEIPPLLMAWKEASPYFPALFPREQQVGQSGSTLSLSHGLIQLCIGFLQSSRA